MFTTEICFFLNNASAVYKPFDPFASITICLQNRQYSESISVTNMITDVQYNKSNVCYIRHREYYCMQMLALTVTV